MNESMSCAPPRSLVPWLNSVNPSPPVARKLFIVTRTVSAAPRATPFNVIAPTRSTHAVLAAARCS